MKKILLTILFLLFCSVSHAVPTTYYVRTDGGTGTQCDGKTDHELAGADGRNCAFNHPAWVIPYNGQGTTSYNMAGGDIVVIHGPEAGTGSYRMGCDGSTHCINASINITNTGNCYDLWTYTCRGNPIPDGAEGSPSTIIGCSTSGCGVNAKPELWGSGRSERVLSTDGTDWVTISDLEITDHEACARGGTNPPVTCQAGISTLNADVGIYALSGSNQVFKNLNIHGMGVYGFHLGGVQNITMENVKVHANGYGGWDASCIDALACQMNGTNLVQDSSITYSGCIENYPVTTPASETADLMTGGCWGQSDTRGGNGDGFGSTATGGDWILIRDNISHNAQDGWDALYVDRGTYGGSMTIDRSLFEGNAGNQLKSATGTIVKNSVIIGNCNYFAGKDFTVDAFPNCRSGGDAVALAPGGADSYTFINDTIWEKDGYAILTVNNYWGTCVDNTYTFYNTIISGSGTAKRDTGTGCGHAPTYTYSLFGIGTLPDGTGNILDNPDFVSAVSDSASSNLASVYLQDVSPAINSADETVSGADAWDYNSYARGASWDIGAIEYGSTPATLTCNADCSACETSEACVASTTTCYWWTNNTCHPAPEQYDDGTACSSAATCLGGYCCSSLCDSSPCLIANGQACTTDSQCVSGHCCSDICSASVCPSVGWSSCSENLLNFTKGDPSEFLNVSSGSVIVTEVDHLTDTYLRKDYGEGYFGNFTHRFKISLSSCTPDGGIGWWAVTSTAKNSLYEIESGADGIDLSYSCAEGTSTWLLYSVETANADTFVDETPTADRYIEVSREGTALTAKFFSDNTFTSPIKTLTIIGAATPYRYLYSVPAYNDGATTGTLTGTLTDLQLSSSCVVPETNVLRGTWHLQ